MCLCNPLPRPPSLHMGRGSLKGWTLGPGADPQTLSSPFVLGSLSLSLVTNEAVNKETDQPPPPPPPPPRPAAQQGEGGREERGGGSLVVDGVCFIVHSIKVIRGGAIRLAGMRRRGGGERSAGWEGRWASLPGLFPSASVRCSWRFSWVVGTPWGQVMGGGECLGPLQWAGAATDLWGILFPSRLGHS